MNLTTPCNAVCNCKLVKYAPVCHESSGTTFFSACHAGCHAIVNDTTFGDCACIPSPLYEYTTHIQGASLRLDHQSSKPDLAALNHRLVTVGLCKQDCSMPYILFTAVTIITNILSCSSKVGYVLVNYRCVETRDKSIAQGVSLLVISLFGLIPGSIIFGAIMDSTCLVWDSSCEKEGNCWFYHRTNFRYYVNLTAACESLLIIISFPI